MFTKQCSKCKETKNVSEFCKDSTRKDCLYPQCKKCRYSSNYYQKYHGIHQRRRRLKFFNITIEEYDEMFDNQNGVCLMCGKPERSNRHLAIDHDHKTGKIRGLLCMACNTHLGWYEINKININNYLRG